MGSDSFDRFIRFKNNHMLTGKVDLETDNGRLLVMNGEFKETPRCFGSCNILTVFELGNFVTLLYFNCGMVRAFMRVFCNILGSRKRHDTFDIDVCIVT